MDNQTQKPLHLVGIGAHLDDCWLGFGGTALKARRRGHRVTFIVAITNFRKLEYLAGRDQEIMAFLNKQTETTGVEFIFLKHDYMRLVNSPELIDELVQILAKLSPAVRQMSRAEVTNGLTAASCAVESHDGNQAARQRLQQLQRFAGLVYARLGSSNGQN